MRSGRARRHLVATLGLLAACGTGAAETPTDAEAASRADPSVTMVGDTAVLELPIGTPANNGELTVRFDAVTEDSRCPTGVQCVWEGNAGVRLTLTSDDETQVFIVNSALEPRWVTFGGYAVGYRELAPYPVSEQPTDRSEYVARIAVVDTR